jgi:hypothetical protein
MYFLLGVICRCRSTCVSGEIRGYADGSKSNTRRRTDGLALVNGSSIDWLDLRYRGLFCGLVVEPLEALDGDVMVYVRDRSSNICSRFLSSLSRRMRSASASVTPLEYSFRIHSETYRVVWLHEHPTLSLDAVNLLQPQPIPSFSWCIYP